MLKQVGNFKCPFKINNINDVQSLLNHVDLTKAIQSSSTENILQLINELLNQLLNHIPEKENQSAFLKEQISLMRSGNHHLRYSTDFMISSCLLFSISPNAYRFLRRSGQIILPHPTTIQGVCSSMNLDPSTEQYDEYFLFYIKQRFPMLQSNDYVVCLMVDEIHIKAGMDFKGGKIVGAAFDSEKTASSAHVFMIQSFLSTYKDVVHILPVCSLTAEQLNTIIKKVVIGLEKIGFKVICQFRQQCH